MKHLTKYLLPALILAGLAQCKAALPDRKEMCGDMGGSKWAETAIPKSHDTIVPLYRQLAGERIEVLLDGTFSVSKTVEGHKRPLRMWEPYPGVLYIQKYFEGTAYDQRGGREYKYEQPVLNRIEFFDSHQHHISSYDVDAHNPYLSPEGGIRVRQYFYDAEGASFMPEAERSSSDKIDEYWVHTIVNGQGNDFSGRHVWLMYKAYLISEEGWIWGALTTHVVLDTTGKEIFRREHPYMASAPAVAEDGSHLLFSILPIETTENAGIKMQTEGFEIWDIKNMKQLYKNENSDPNMWVSEPWRDDLSDWLGISYVYSNSAELQKYVYLFDPVRRIVYDRAMTNIEMITLRKDWSKFRSWSKVVEMFSFNEKSLSHD
jgi:hypothetical protein